jgi:hypothetical protein
MGMTTVPCGFDVESNRALLLSEEGAVFNPLVEGGVWDEDTIVRRHFRGSTLTNGFAEIHDYCKGCLPILHDVPGVVSGEDLYTWNEIGLTKVPAKYRDFIETSKCPQGGATQGYYDIGLKGCNVRDKHFHPLPKHGLWDCTVAVFEVKADVISWRLLTRDVCEEA